MIRELISRVTQDTITQNTEEVQMPIESFSIKESGPIERAECKDVPQIMAIAGPNGVGKSTLLEKLLTPDAHGVEVGISQETDIAYYSPHRSPSTVKFNQVLLSRMEDMGAPTYREAISETPEYLGTLAGMMTPDELPKQISNQNSRSKNDADYIPYFETKRRICKIKLERQRILEKIYEEKGKVSSDLDLDFVEPLRSALSKVLPGVELKKVEKSGQEYRIEFEDQRGKIVGFDDLSSGERDAVAMIALLVEKQLEERIREVEGKSPKEEVLVLLIDSPEVYLHPAMQRRFIEYVEKTVEESGEYGLNLQVILCTHSRPILKHLDNESVYFLLYPDEDLENQLVCAEDIDSDKLRPILGELGLANLSSGRPLLLVEGDLDKEVLSRLYPGLEDEIEIVPMRSKHAVESTTAVINRAIPELASVGVNAFALVDGDRDIGEDKPENVYRLRATCMENILLQQQEELYEALAVLTGESKLNENGISSPSDLDELLTEIMQDEEYQKKEIEKRLNEKVSTRLNFSARGEDDEFDQKSIEDHIDEIAEKKKERIGGHMEDIEKEVSEIVEKEDLNRIDGKLMLGKVAERFSIQTDTLSRTIADKLSENDELPSALHEQIEEIRESALHNEPTNN